MNTDEHSAASEAATKPDVTADKRRWTPIEFRIEDCQSSGRTEPESCVAGGGIAGSCQELGDLKTKAAERNNVAKTTILHACTDSTSCHQDTAKMGIQSFGFEWSLGLGN
jgi:hypothetical protein